jgi:hypothetical protein
MQDFEKLGVFYLGREYDLRESKPLDNLILYDSKDLVTHAVCVGMTGSGKTGLCLALIEEAAIDSIPAIIIDPKGDLANLLLTFPQLRGEDFAPWVNAEDAAKKNLSVADYANAQAETWKKGLESWGQDGARIQRLRDAVGDIRVYTPGSNAGFPVSILKSFAAPTAEVLGDGELLRERVSTTVTSLLGLLGIEADPLQSREHILLSTILNWAWMQGKDLDLGLLIQYVQNPPVAKVGVLDIETFYPSKDRFGLVMSLNNLLAAPGFSAWMEGEPLDIQQLLYTPHGKPRLAIFSIAHLNDAERMFFVSLLLNQVVGWMRAQSGTTSLRALLYMDEIFGYFPPTANPPSKLPLLILLKQARAFGLGVVLATQNPVDLDYKGLANAGTWFIGRLQTERDKARVLEGLEGAAAAAGAKFDRAMMEQTLAGLGNRIFLMNNTHEDAPVVFQTRWALSYLRGPLTRNQIKTLMDPLKPPVTMVQPPPPVITPTTPVPTMTATPPTPVMAASGGGAAPSIPPDVQQFFIPTRGSAPAGSSLIYKPALIGSAKVNFVDAKTKVDFAQEVTAMTPITDEVVPVSWDNAREAGVAVSDLEREAASGAAFANLPPAAAKAKSYAAWSKDFLTWLYGVQKVELLKSPNTKALSKPGESERDFRLRLGQAGREGRDAAMAQLRGKYAPKIAALQERLRKAQQAMAEQEEQAKQQQMQTAISFGATLLGAFVGRKGSSVGRATTAVRGVGRSLKERSDVGRAEETVEVLQKQLADLDQEFKAKTQELESSLDAQAETLETITIKPKKSNIAVQLVALAWAPYWKGEGGEVKEAWV